MLLHTFIFSGRHSEQRRALPTRAAPCRHRCARLPAPDCGLSPLPTPPPTAPPACTRAPPVLVNPLRSRPARPPSTRSPTDSPPISSLPPERAQVTLSGFVARFRRGEAVLARQDRPARLAGQCCTAGGSPWGGAHRRAGARCCAERVPGWPCAQGAEWLSFPYIFTFCGMCGACECLKTLGEPPRS